MGRKTTLANEPALEAARRAMVHDRLNNETFEWLPKWQGEYEPPDIYGVANWDGLLLDGWRAPPKSGKGSQAGKEQ